MRQKVTDLVEEMVAPFLASLALDLIEVEYKKEGANWILRVFIDKPGGAIDIDDCAKVSEALSAELDAKDPIPNAYFLEVSSAGAERPLKRPEDFERAVGKRVFLSFYEPQLGQKAIEGTLLHYGDGLLKVQGDKEPFDIQSDKVAAARLAIEW